MTEHPPERYGTVRDWMTREPAAVAVDCPVETALGQMRRAEIRHLLVFDEERLIGIVSNRDLRRLAVAVEGSTALSEPVSSIMTENPVTIAPETAIEVAARLLLETKIGALPVRDGDEIVGIFTTSDALEALLAMVERPGA
ncbi:MAG TPA: CBS domain-containing protein [Methylomirabilota bacterium]|nr:CBS domain-containing protein [Methylomirabilota bacterium]